MNAIYFKGKWDEEFDPKLTEQGEFWLSKVLPVIYFLEQNIAIYGMFHFNTYLMKVQLQVDNRIGHSWLFFVLSLVRNT